MINLQQIEAGLKMVDEQIRMLSSMIPLLREIRQSIDEIKRGQERQYSYELQKVSVAVGELTSQFVRYGVPNADRYQKEFEELRSSINRDDWPNAVDPELICDNEEKTAERSAGILDLLIGEHLKGKSFLDYGCGDGSVVFTARSHETRLSIGYDIDLSKIKYEGEFTSEFEEIKRKGPYDVILIHDVLDHAIKLDPIQILIQAKSVLAYGGRIYVRNHPWCSRHGAHLYEKKNKAFLQLVFDSSELVRIGGLVPEQNVKIMRPIETYRHWFVESGLTIVCETPIRDAIEPFFRTPSIATDRIKAHFEDEADMKNQLEISFVEYILRDDSAHHLI
jgi:2-polyprenyl-3-methyl-5-hydroxy-6-metoxy-1,4-benzoquinol methylase